MKRVEINEILFKKLIDGVNIVFQKTAGYCNTYKSRSKPTQ